jgi:hypothetical protein
VPFPTASQDHLPAGPRIDVTGLNLFPSSAGDAWTYNLVQANGSPGLALQQTVTSGPDADGRVVVTTSDASGSSTDEYIVNAQGVVDPAPLGDGVPARASSIVGAIPEYVTPLYGVGTVRRHVRSGPWGADLDGDGREESFRFEFSQELVGFESLQVSASTSLSNVAHFRNVYRTTFRSTRAGLGDYSVEIRTETWYAPGLGLVKEVGNAFDSAGAVVDEPYTYLLSTASVSGVNWSNVPPPAVLDGTPYDVPLVHNALVYDPVRERYYASIPGSVPGVGNTIATIHPATGQITYSAPIGSEPNALALSADASVLYVGLGSGKVVRLGVPGMTEQASTTLPSASWGNSVAESIAVSPVDASAVAVALARPGTTPRHAGVALLRNMVLQPNITPDFVYNNLIAFDPLGTSLYAFSTEDGSGLRRLAILSDGVQLQSGVVAATPYTARELRVTANQVVVGRAVHAATSLDARGLVSGAADCQPQRTGPNLLCLATSDLSGRARLLIASPASYVLQAALLFSTAEPVTTRRRIVEGPSGQVAVSYALDGPGSVSMVRLFTSPQLAAVTPPSAPTWTVASYVTQDGQAREINLAHNALVYDAVRNLYYATVPGSVVGAGNSIAVINPANGQVAHSAPIGSEPNALAIAADASALYVGLDGSGEVAKLQLPALLEQGRVRLSYASNTGQARAETIAVSPADATVAAVSMAWWTSSPRHAGVVLLRNLVAQPGTTPASAGSNLIVFDDLGSTLYGLGSELSTAVVDRIAVLPNGLAEQAASEDIGGGSQGLSFGGNRVIAKNTVFAAPGLAAVGTVSGAANCFAARVATALLCDANTTSLVEGSRVLVAAMANLAVSDTLQYAASEPYTPRRMVQGPANQIAVSYPASLGAAPPKLRLFSSGALP